MSEPGAHERDLAAGASAVGAVLAPVAALGPLLAGALASLAGYPALFAALIAVGLAGLVGLHRRVTTPAAVPQTAGGE